MPRFSSLPLKFKLSVVVSAIGVVVLTAALGLRWAQTDRLLRERMLLRTGVLADIAAQACAGRCGQAYLDWLTKDHDIKYAAFFGPDGALEVFSGEGNLEPVQPSGEDIFKVEDAVYDASRPVYGKKAPSPARCCWASPWSASTPTCAYTRSPA
jgi:hypothetical protein